MTPTEAELALKVSSAILSAPSLAYTKRTGHFLSRQERDPFQAIQHQLQRRRRDLEKGQCRVQKSMAFNLSFDMC